MPSRLSPSPSRGSTLIMVTMLTVGLALISGVLLRYAIIEARLNRRNLARIEAKNAAEAALEYGASELAVRFRANRGFTSATLATTPIGIHSSRLATLYAVSSGAPTSISPSSVKLYVGNTSTRIITRIDKTDPNNAYDPLRGQTVASRFVRILSTATANVPGVGSAAAYATQSFEVRDSQLFNYAIFYNLPMEFHPGADMEVWGPVHSNETAYLTASSTLKFFDTYTTAGSMFASAKSTTGRPTGQSVYFTNGNIPSGSTTPDIVALNGHTFNTGTTTVSTWVDSALASRVSDSTTFAEKASQLWRGNAQDATLGVEKQNPPGVLSPSDARKLILPPDSSSTSGLSAEQLAARTSIEEQKFSTQTGFYVVVDRSSSTSTTPRVTVFTSPADAADFKNSSNRSTWLTNNPSKVVTPPAGLIETKRRMRDVREDKVVNMVDIDLGKLKTALDNPTSFPSESEDTAAAALKAAWKGSVYVDIDEPARGYTTTSDITLPSGVSASQTDGEGSGSGTATAVRLLNGKRLPNLPTTNADAGFSFATNAPVYIAGHFNANGNFSDGSERAPDTGWDNSTSTLADDIEVPALVAGDAVNILSSNWVDSSTGLPIGDTRIAEKIDSDSTTKRRATNTEVSAVLMGGIVETPGDGAGYSGGVENYPRFHEGWGGGRTFRYRGSIIALYQSAYATGIWNRVSTVYSAPTRKWGFHNFLRDGTYPPFTPTLRSFRRVDYRDITKTEYDTLLATTAFGFIEMVPATTP